MTCETVGAFRLNDCSAAREEPGTGVLFTLGPGSCVVRSLAEEVSLQQFSLLAF